ncbi:MAG: germination protein YpeB [Clostridia bacterium]
MNNILKKIEDKITNWRKNADHRITVLVILSIFTATAVYAMETTKMFRVNKQIGSDQNNRAVYETTEYMKNVEVLLAKVQVTSTPEQSAKTLAEIWKQSNLAKTNLVELPSSQKTIEGVSNFLTQLSDYSYTLMKSSIDGQKLKDDQYLQLSNLYNYAVTARGEFSKCIEDINKGKLKWNEVDKQLKKNIKKQPKTVQTSGIEGIGKVFQDYEGLIYDGAFSNHILNVDPVMLNGMNISIKDGEEIIKKIFKDEKIERIKYVSEGKGKIPTYGYELKLKENAKTNSIELTRDSGMLLWMISDRKVKEAKLSIDEAKAKGLEFIEKLGIEGMKDTYYSVYENMATINYAFKEKDCIMYPDLIKVKIALDNGEVCSVETHGYIYNHKFKRDIKPKISLAEAKSRITAKVNIESENLAIIPTESKSEVLTYEFKGKVNDKNFLIYINAQTGDEEKILLIIDSEKGILTM